MKATSEERAQDYRTRADAALATASATGLDRVQERHSAAAAVWLELAAHEDRRTARALEVRAMAAARLVEDAMAEDAGLRDPEAAPHA
jgi:hypothetical protein